MPDTRLLRPVPGGTWIAIDDPEALCAVYESLWDDALHRHARRDLPFGASAASAAVEAMAWDPWSHFEHSTWRSPWFDDDGVQVQVGARAYVEDDDEPTFFRRPSPLAGVRITSRGGRDRPPTPERAGRLVLECFLVVRDESVQAVERTRLTAGYVVDPFARERVRPLHNTASPRVPSGMNPGERP